MKKILSLISLVLIFAMALSMSSCDLVSGWGSSDKNDDVTPDTDGSVSKTGVWENAIYLEDTEIGQGSKTVEVEVKADGKSITFTVKTDAETLGEALIENGLISGEDGAYGLYIKSVNGITADYDVDKYYWAFYQNGEYMMTGVDGTEIDGGEHYELVREKG